MDDVRRSQDTIPIELLDRYLTGAATADEQACVAAWIASDAGREAVDALARRDASRDPMVEAAWVRVARKMGEYNGELAAVSEGATSIAAVAHGPDEDVVRRERAGGVRAWRGRVVGLGTWPLRRWGWVTGIAICTALVFVLLRVKSLSDRDITRSFTTNGSQQAAVLLPDGTRVTLAPNTKLQIVHFGVSARTVVLDGEAYFHVARSSGVPFSVQSGGTTTRVLGTGFLVRHRTGDMGVRVAVAEGRVRTSFSLRPDSGVVLGSGAIGDFRDSIAHVSTIEELVPRAEWVRGQLVFHDTPVMTILATLSRWYGYQFRYANTALATKDVTIAVNMQSSAEALATLEQILDVSFTVTGDTITLAPHPTRLEPGVSRTRVYDVWTPLKEAGR